MRIWQLATPAAGGAGTIVPGEFIGIDSGKASADNDMAAMADVEGGQRKYLPYLMINMLGTRKEGFD